MSLFLILPGVLILAIAWSLGRRYSWLAISLSLLCLVVLGMFHYLMYHPSDYTAGPRPLAIRVIYLFGFNVWPSLAIVLAGVLIAASLQPSSLRMEHMWPFHSRLGRLMAGSLASVLILYLAYIIFWGSVWDQTSDGIFGVFISHQTALIAVGTGMIIALALRGAQRLAGIFFILILPVLFYQSFEAGWDVSYHEITEARAERITRALEVYRDREGQYPESLKALTPRDLLYIQQAMILAGEEWCYEGGQDTYRLAAFYREHFSAPVSLRVYKTAGEPSGPLPCEERLAAMKERYYSPMEDRQAMQPLVPTPLPEVDVGIQKTEIQPVLQAAAALPGSWAPEGNYFLFGTQNADLTLHFLYGRTGEICTAAGRFPRVDRLHEHHAWLPDGRLLFVDATGGIAVLAPCGPELKVLTNPASDPFYQIGASASENGILDSRTLQVLPIPDVTPIQYDLHWDRAAWLPGGEQLVIARLNGRSGSGEGVTLYLVDGRTGSVQNSLFLEGEFGQSAPWVEGVGEWEVLIHGQGELLLLDFNTNPAEVTNVLGDLFGLDVKYPDEMSASGSHIMEDGSGYYLVARLNHPRNRATYLYDSTTQRVYIYDHEHHTLMLFPDGYLMEMARWEAMPSYRDEYDIVMADRPEVVQPRLRLEGHTPREYPHLSFAYLPQTSQLVVASAHGVSLVSLENGEMEAFWTLAGDGFSPWLIAAPDGSALVASKDFGGLYYIPLP
jgi:hypothetical protein